MDNSSGPLFANCKPAFHSPRFSPSSTRWNPSTPTNQWSRSFRAKPFTRGGFSTDELFLKSGMSSGLLDMDSPSKAGTIGSGTGSGSSPGPSRDTVTDTGTETKTEYSISPKLFSTPTKQTSTRTFPSTSSSKDLSNLGYFAFPPTGTSPTGTTGIVSSPQNRNQSQASVTVTGIVEPEPVPIPSFSILISASASASSSTSTSASNSPLHSAHLARLEREKAQAILGEEQWVHSGGILRDTNGNRDFARTEQIRTELRLRDWEKQVLERWEGYERRWGELVRKERSLVRGEGGEGKGGEEGEGILFEDIPWPVCVGMGEAEGEGSSAEAGGINLPQSATNVRGRARGLNKPTSQKPPQITLSDLNPKSIEIFMTESLVVRGCTVTKKERIRSSLLRWHPDKLRGIVAKVMEEDKAKVEEGIGIVIRCLREMNSTL